MPIVVFVVSVFLFTWSSPLVKTEVVVIFLEEGIEVEGVVLFETLQNYLVQISIDGDRLERLIEKNAHEIVRIKPRHWSAIPMNNSYGRI